MFKHVEGLGDIRQYIDPDFELNDKLQSDLNFDIKKKINNENLEQLMTQNLGKGEYVSKDFVEYAEAVKEVYSDGVRTPDEVARLDKMLQEKLRTSEPLDITKIPEEDKAKIANLSGRNGKYQSPEAQAAEPQTRTIEPKQASVLKQQEEIVKPSAEAQKAPTEKAPNTQQTSPKQTFNDLNPQEKGEHVHGLRMGRNSFLDRENGIETPKKEKNKTRAPQTNSNTALNLKMQQQTQRT